MRQRRHGEPFNEAKVSCGAGAIADIAALESVVQAVRARASRGKITVSCARRHGAIALAEPVQMRWFDEAEENVLFKK
jgi:hypothetical protein